MLCIVSLACASASARAGLPSTYAVQRAGLVGGIWGTTGAVSEVAGLTSSGLVAGISNLYVGNSGQSAWIHDPATNASTRIGLTDPTVQSVAGLEYGDISAVTLNGLVVGYSGLLFAPSNTAVSTTSGRTWVYNANTKALTQTGILIPGSLVQSKSDRNDFVSATGVVAGVSLDEVGRSYSWVFDPAVGASVRTGEFPSGTTSTNVRISSTGVIAGRTVISGGLSGLENIRAWTYSPTLQTTTQVGLIDSVHTANGQNQSSRIGRIADNGVLTGTSTRFVTVNTTTSTNGQNTWAYVPATNTTYPTGLTTSAHTGSNGYQFSENGTAITTTGRSVGYSQRIAGTKTDNGRNTWAFEPTTGTTFLTGLTTPEYTSASGYQYSANVAQNDTGYAVGYSERSPLQFQDNARSAWIYDPVSHASTRVGLTGGIYADPTGYAYSHPEFISPSNQVAGYSYRYDNDTLNGIHTWAYNHTTGSITRTGLDDPKHTTSTGDSYSFNDFQSPLNHIAGSAFRLKSDGSDNGRNTWFYDPITGNTVATGLTDARHTGSADYQNSRNTAQNALGVTVGLSSRLTDLDTSIGDDAWYFDPATLTTFDITAGVANHIRTSDQFASSFVNFITDDGLAFGFYTFFLDGLGAGETHAFVYRPDFGFQDINLLVQGGIASSDFQLLQRVRNAFGLDQLVGYGVVPGQTTINGSVFVLVPSPSSAAIVLACGLVPTRRRRRR